MNWCHSSDEWGLGRQKRRAPFDVSNSSPIKKTKARFEEKLLCALKAFQAQVKVINLQEDNSRLFSFHCLCAMLRSLLSYSYWKKDRKEHDISNNTHPKKSPPDSLQFENKGQTACALSKTRLTFWHNLVNHLITGLLHTPQSTSSDFFNSSVSARRQS